jgi:hypothetical protein
MGDFPRPVWVPATIPTIQWTLDHLREYLPGKGLTVFRNGTCVVWPRLQAPTEAACKESLLSVVEYHPDFKVRRHGGGDFLVTFRGGVGGVMPGEIMRSNQATLRAEAFSQGKLPSEILKEEAGTSTDDTDLIAGLYVRARLYLDAASPVIVYNGYSGQIS